MGLTFYTSASLLAFIACAILSPFALLKGKKDRQTYLFAGLTFLAGAWCSFPFVTGQAGDDVQAVTLARLIYLAALFVPPVFLHLTYAILDLPKTRWDRSVLRCSYIISIPFILVLPTDLFIAGVLRYAPFFGVIPGPFYTAYVAFFGVTCTIGFIKLLQGYWNASGFRKNQLRYIFVSWFLAYVAGLLHFMPSYFHVEPFPHDFLVMAFAVLSSYAIIKYRLLDIRLALTRTTILTLVYMPILGLPFLVGYVGQEFLIAYLGKTWWLVPLAICTILATVGPYLYLALQRRAEARLLREQRHYQTTLLNAAKGMTQIRDLRRLLDLVVHMLTGTMKLTRAGIFLLDERTAQYVLQASRDRDVLIPGLTLEADDPLIEWLRQEQGPIVSEEIKQMVNGMVFPARLEASLKRMDASVVVPSFAEERTTAPPATPPRPSGRKRSRFGPSAELIGFLVLGDKRNGQVYSQDDLNMLQTLANQAALAIENARFYAQEKERQAAMFHTASLASLGTMAGSMSHQVNNRFNVLSVIGAIQQKKLTPLLAQQPHDPAILLKALEEALAQFKSVEDEAIHGGKIVQSIRKIIRPSTEGYRPVSLAEAIQTGLDVVQYKVKFDDFDFHLDVPTTLPKLLGDQAELGECFLNLIDNAYDAITMKTEYLNPPNYRGSLRITGSTTTESDPQTKHPRLWLVVEVSDNGLGVKPDDLPKLCIPFFTTKATAVKGTGLGLFVIKKIIEAHGGTITVASNYGVGMTFTIQLPALEPTPIASASDDGGNAHA